MCSSMCHHTETASKWYVVPPSIKEAFTTRTYLEYGMKATTTEDSGTSNEVPGRNVSKKKHSVVSCDEDKKDMDAVRGSYARKVTDKKGILVSSSDEDEAAWEATGAELFAVTPGEEEEGLCCASGVSADQKVTPELTQLPSVKNTSPHTHYNLRGPMEKRKTLQKTDDWIF